MNKLKITLIAFFASVMAISSSVAEIRIGLSAGFAQFEAAGNETLKDTSGVTTHTVQANAIVPSVFAEIAHSSGFGLGIDMVQGTASLAGSKNTRNLTNTASQGNDTGTNVADAEVDGINTYYLIKSFDSGFLVKAGMSQADVNTKEVLGTGSTYGNATVDGSHFGIGFARTNDSGFFYRAAVEYTDFDELSLTSGVADATTATKNVVKADVDVTMAKFSIGKSF
tara:strand:- start:776 stop:1450 length:675 start_codon:yes stop_codon:yes gene_type:complete